MVPAALPAAIALIAGAAAGTSFDVPWHVLLWALPALVVSATTAWRRRAPLTTMWLSIVAFACAGAILGAHDRDQALDTPIRRLLDREFGGFLIGALDIPGDHGPIAARLVLTEDALPGDNLTTLRADLRAIQLHDIWLPTAGGIVISVGGVPAAAQVSPWRRGRTVEVPLTFRRPARYLDEGVADFERESALDGVTLLASVKSALLVNVVRHGNRAEELAADVRAYVRRRIRDCIAPYSTRSAAIVAAVLIGDRSALEDEVRQQLQAAGTYHVIAISGGNVALLAGVLALVLGLTGVSRRPAAFITLLLLIAYAEIVTGGPSVWRATLMAAVYLAARLLDHRSGPWQAAAVASGLLVCARPLDVRTAGFLLTFGATGALLEISRRWSAPHQNTPRAWVTMSVAASAAVEVALLPVMAVTFSRVTLAGLVLNLVAVPLMVVVQMAGMVVVCADRLDAIEKLSAWVAHLAAAGILESARLVDVAPWLTWRVPAPGAGFVLAYYAGLGAVLLCTRARVAWVVLGTTAIVIATGIDPLSRLYPNSDDRQLRLTVFDVGQGDAMALRFPHVSERDAIARTMMVDTGGSPFGGGAFDIGARVVEPALWGMGIRSLDTLLLTHGDPDHIGGAPVLLDDFRPRLVWQGIPVAGASNLQAVLARALERRSRVEELRADQEFGVGPARVAVLNPPRPDWERQKVRNDDSVVLEVLYGRVAMLLTGDIGADVERQIVPHLIPAPIRILKVAHHGSRTSTSQELLDAWRPQIALISCGRSNPFGHPAPEVVERLEASGARIYRTDRDGEITIETDGQRVSVTTYAQDRGSRPSGPRP